MRYLLDTDICISLLHGNANVARKINEVGFEQCAISEISKAELLVGRRIATLKGRVVKNECIDDFLDNLTIIPFSDHLNEYVENKAELVVSGRQIEDFDLIIASTAASERLVLVTGNSSHMSRIPGIMIEDWRITHE